MSEFYDRDRAAFYRAIQAVREQGMNLTVWLEFFLSGLATQLTEVTSLGEMAIRSDLLKSEYGLNQRQELAVAYLLKNVHLTVQLFESSCPEFSRRTLQRDLTKLEEKGVALRKGETNNVSYELRD